MNKQWLVLIIKFGVSAAILMLLLTKVNPGIILDTWRAEPLSNLLLVAALFVMQPMLAVWRWYIIMRCLGISCPLARTIQIFWVGMFMTAVVPGIIIGDGVRMWMVLRSGVELSKAVNSVVLDRVAAFFVLVLLVIAFIPLLDRRIVNVAVPGGIGVVVLFIVASTAVFAIGLCARFPPRWNRFRVVRAIEHLVDDLRALCAVPWCALFAIGISVITVFIFALCIYVSIHGMHEKLGLPETLVLGPLVMLSLALPISLGGWGVREGAMVWLFGAVGVPAQVSLSASILLGLISLAVSLPGGLVWLKWCRASLPACPKSAT